MLQIIYTSISTKPATAGVAEEICRQARDNNRRDEITGILTTKGERFLQVLEGPKATVEETFMRLVVDPRHRQVLVISRRMITRREFGDWEMAHYAAAGDCADIFAKVALILEKGPASSHDAFNEFVV